MRKLFIIVLALVLASCSCAKKSDSSVENNSTETRIENATVFKHDAYGFYIELYPEYKQTESTARRMAEWKEEIVNFGVTASIGFQEFDEVDKKKQMFPSKFFPRSPEIEEMLNKSHPNMQGWEVCSFHSEEGSNYIDGAVFLPPHKNNLAIHVTFTYPKKDIDAMKKKVKEMLSTIRIIDKNSDKDKGKSKSIQIGMPPTKYKNSE